ncbi:hypothetical protein V8E54_002466 [Elaphomyces granulatus]
MSNLASIYWYQKRWTEAEKLDVQAMEIKKAVLGPEQPETLVNCVQLQEQRLGPTHPHTISATADLKAWQEEHSTHSPTGRSSFHGLKYISRTISTVRGAIKFGKK